MSLRHLLKRKLLGLVLTFVMALGSLQAQEKYSSEELQEDLHIIADIAKGISPKMEDKDRERIDRLIGEKSKDLEGKSMDVIEFVNFISEMNMQTKFDEHAALDIDENVIMPFLLKSTLFPIPISIVSDKVLVNTKESSIPFGMQIHSINGRAIDSLLRTMAKDYDNNFSKRRLEKQFSIMFLIKYGSQEFFKITYSDPRNSKEMQEVTIDGLPFEQWQSEIQKGVYPLDEEDTSKLIHTKHYPSLSTSYLQLNSFSWDKEKAKGFFSLMQSNHKQFDKELKSIFKEFAELKSRTLIIDLRNNYGGNIRVPGILMSYISKHSFAQSAQLLIQDFDFPHQDLIVRISGDEVEEENDVQNFIKFWKKKFEKTDSNYVMNFIEETEEEPSKDAFKGDVYLLVGGRSISASSYFTAMFKSQNRGLVVGEELGGSHHAITAGKTLTYVLPNTRIKVTVPLMIVNFSKELYQAVPELKVRPDIELSFEEAYRYFINEEDAVLEKTLELIAENE